MIILLGVVASAQENISLNGPWTFWVPEDAIGVPEAVKAGQTVQVPHTYNIMDGLEDYAGKAFYSRDLLVACYSHLEIDPARKPGLYSKGDITQAEDIADLGGFLATLDAYKDRLQVDGYTGETMNEQLRKFFESFAYVWRVQYSDEKLAQFPEKDVHSHARLRTNGVMMNTDLWYDLFGVDRNCKLYLPKERRAYIW